MDKIPLSEDLNINLMIKNRMLLSKEYEVINHYVSKQKKAVANNQEAREILDFNI